MSDAIKGAVSAALTPAPKDLWQAHDLVIGGSYIARNWPLVTYTGLDHYHGETTHKFHTGERGVREFQYVKAERLNEFLGPKTTAAETPWVGPQPIETAPPERLFLAENRNGDWLKAQRYDNPFGYENTVIDNRSGKWWETKRWMPIPADFATEGTADA